jgi:hypothetical protein
LPTLGCPSSSSIAVDHEPAGREIADLLRVERGLGLVEPGEVAHEGELGEPEGHLDPALVLAGNLALAEQGERLAQRQLALRHDHGSQFVADDYQAELAFLGIASSPAFVREPEGNGCAERLIRTQGKPPVIRRFATIEELRQAVLAFQRLYNQSWIVQRHGYRTPAQVRAEQLGTLAAA